MPRLPAPDDDSALRWDEYDDPSYIESEAAMAARQAAGAMSDEEAATTSGAAFGIDAATDAVTTDAVTTDAVTTDAALEHGAPSGRAAAVRLLTPLFALVYLAYSVGWIIGIGLVPLSGPTVLIEVMYQFSEFLAIIASALWFAAVVTLTRDGRTAHRLGWLALGTLVLLPWPIVLGVLA